VDSDFQAIIADPRTGRKITKVSISLGQCETSVSAAVKTTDDQYVATVQPERIGVRQLRR
jgi:hypothetical protein